MDLKPDAPPIDEWMAAFKKCDKCEAKDKRIAELEAALDARRKESKMKHQYQITLEQRIEALEGRQSKMKILEFNGYGPTAPRVYLPAQNIISFHLIDFNGNYGTHIDLPEWRYIRVGAYPEEVKKKLEAALLPGGGE